MSMPTLSVHSSFHRSHRWALRSLRAFRRFHDQTQALYGIVQGGVHTRLRDESVDFIKALPFFGVAIGGIFSLRCMIVRTLI